MTCYLESRHTTEHRVRPPCRFAGCISVFQCFLGCSFPVIDIAGLQYFMQQVDGLECAFDTGNFVIFHEDELAAFELFAPRIRTLHLKDRCTAPRHAGDTPLRCADGTMAYTLTIRNYLPAVAPTGLHVSGSPYGFMALAGLILAAAAAPACRRRARRKDGGAE